MGRKTVEVLAGHTNRPTARKSRNNKVNTTRGQRDRRFRLSVDTAIQFYDIQDRLGYDRASDAVDWLIDKAKDSISKLSKSSFQQCDRIAQLGDLNDIQSRDLPEPVYVPKFDSVSDNSVNLSEYNVMENSALFHQGGMEQYMQDLSYKIEDSSYPIASSSSMKHDISMISFNSTLRSEKDEYQPHVTGRFSHEISNLYKSTQDQQYQEQFVGINQELFPVMAAQNDNV